MPIICEKIYKATCKLCHNTFVSYKSPNAQDFLKVAKAAGWRLYGWRHAKCPDCISKEKEDGKVIYQRIYTLECDICGRSQTFVAKREYEVEKRARREGWSIVWKRRRCRCGNCRGMHQ